MRLHCLSTLSLLPILALTSTTPAPSPEPTDLAPSAAHADANIGALLPLLPPIGALLIPRRNRLHPGRLRPGHAKPTRAPKKQQQQQQQQSHHHRLLEPRQAVGVTPNRNAPASLSVPDAAHPVPSVTVYYLPSEIAPGNVVEVAYTHTQSFADDVAGSARPSVLAGSIGLGTLTGEAGAVRTAGASGAVAIKGAAVSTGAGARGREACGAAVVGGVVVVGVVVGGVLGV